MGYVYRLINRENGLSYIGQVSRPKRRLPIVFMNTTKMLEMDANIYYRLQFVNLVKKPLIVLNLIIMMIFKRLMLPSVSISNNSIRMFHVGEMDTI